MARPINDPSNYMFTDPNSQNPNLPRTRGQNYAPTLTAPGLIQQSPILANNGLRIPHSPHNTFNPMPAHEPHHPQPPMLVTYGFPGQPPVESSYAPRDASNAVAYEYRPGTDPPVVGEPGARYQPSWPSIRSHHLAYPGHEMSHSMWPDASQPANTEASHHHTAYEFSHQWNGETQSSFNLPRSPQASYLSHQHEHHGRESMTPVETPWSPDRVGYQSSLRQDPPTPPTLNNDDHHPQDHVLYSPQSTSGATPPANGPFGHFPEQDPARTIIYHEQRSGVDDAKNSKMLGLGARIDSLSSDYTAHNSDHNQPSTSAQVFEVQVDGPSRTVRLSEDLEAHFPNQPALKKLALYILNQGWCLLNDEEPPITPTEPVVVLKFSKKVPKSRFDPFFDGKLRCLVVEANGDLCSHGTTRKDRAVGHARAHFGYKPFSCAGKCGKQGCLERYTCSSFRNDHVGRKKNPKKACAICQKLLTSQNLKRHMKQHTSSPTQVTALSPQGGEIEAPPSKRPKLSIFRRPFGKK